MPWPLQCQVPAVALASVASSAGGPMSGPPPALASALGASVLGCAAARPVIPTIAIATREKVFICHAPGEKRADCTQTRDRDIGTRRVPCHGRGAAEPAAVPSH